MLPLHLSSQTNSLRVSYRATMRLLDLAPTIWQRISHSKIVLRLGTLFSQKRQQNQQQQKQQQEKQKQKQQKQQQQHQQHQQQQQEQQQQPRRLLANLPPELLLEIADKLDWVSLRTFSLTCRATLGVCFPPGSNNTDAGPRLSNKPTLLLLLEKDLPQLYYCNDCIRLHRWHASWFRHPAYLNTNCPSSSSSASYPGLDCTNDALQDIDDGYRVPYCCARVVLKRHLYGPAHGVPAQALNWHAVRPIDHLCKVRTDKTWTARIATVVDGSNDSDDCDDQSSPGSCQLLLSSTRLYSHKPGDAASLRRFIDHSRLDVCEHIPSMSSFSSNPTHGLPELEAQPAPHYFTDSCLSSSAPVIRSCTQCMTDYSVAATWSDKTQAWTVTLVTYLQVGMHQYKDWYPTREWHTPCSRPREYTPGFVRHLWSAAGKAGDDEAVVAPEGVWTAEPDSSSRLFDLTEPLPGHW